MKCVLRFLDALSALVDLAKAVVKWLGGDDVE